MNYEGFENYFAENDGNYENDDFQEFPSSCAEKSFSIHIATSSGDYPCKDW